MCACVCVCAGQRWTLPAWVFTVPYAGGQEHEEKVIRKLQTWGPKCGCSHKRFSATHAHIHTRMRTHTHTHTHTHTYTHTRAHTHSHSNAHTLTHTHTHACTHTHTHTHAHVCRYVADLSKGLYIIIVGGLVAGVVLSLVRDAIGIHGCVGVDVKVFGCRSVGVSIGVWVPVGVGVVWVQILAG